MSKKAVPWDPARIHQFVVGDITLGELEGIDKKAQYEMAEMGFKFLKQGKLKNARKIYEGLIVLDPRDAYFHLVLGSISQRENKLEEADASYSRSIGIHPKLSSAYANRGEVRLLQKRTEEARADLEQAVALDPEKKDEATRRAVMLLQRLEN